MNLELFENATRTEQAFLIFAIFGTAFFVLRVMTMLVSGFGADDGGDAAHTDHSDHVHGSDAAFKLLSINSITGFIMMFGWAGLAAVKEHHLSDAISVLVGFVAGLITMYITAILVKLAFKLTSPGSRFNIETVVGAHGTTYMQIPASGQGQVKIIHEGANRIIDATSQNGKEIKAFANIVITKVIDQRTVAVKEA